MSIPTVNEIALSIMNEFGEDTSNSNLLTQVEEWIKNVYDEIGIQTNWKYLWLIEAINTSITLRTYSFAGIFEQEISAQFSVDNMPLVYKTRQELMNLGINILLAGKPKYWYTESYSPISETFTIGLYPVPDAVYSISFFGKISPQELISTTKLPMPKQFIFVLKDGVRFRYKMDDKDYSGATMFRQIYQENRNTLKQQNDIPVAQKQRMYVQDIGFSSDPLVRFPPDHFRN